MKKVALALVAVIAVAAALLLVLWAAFPYIYGESGAARYAYEHRGEAIVQLLGAAVLLGVAWYCIRHSLAGRTWLVIGGVVVAVVAADFLMSYVRVPAGAWPVGSNWYVTVTHQPREIDSVYYSLYYKRRGHYQSIASLVSEYSFVAPDCLMFRGLKVSRRPKYAMCGYRLPAGSYDTTRTDAALLSKARTQPAYSDNWESIIQQQDFPAPPP
jgi:hypothetical protein